MKDYIVNDVNALLNESVLWDCLATNPEARLSFARAFFKHDAQKVVLVSDEDETFTQNFVRDGKKVPAFVFLIDGCMIGALEILHEEPYNMESSAIQYAASLYGQHMFDERQLHDHYQLKMLFILENGDPFPGDYSPLTEMAKINFGYDKMSISINFLCLEKLINGKFMLSDAQVQWGCYLKGMLERDEIKDAGVRSMDNGFLECPEEDVLQYLARQDFADERDRAIVDRMKEQGVPSSMIAFFTGMTESRIMEL